MHSGRRRARQFRSPPNATRRTVPNGFANARQAGDVVIARSLFREEHEMWREAVRRFIATEIVPFHAQWEHDGIVPRELWLKAGEQGLLCCTVPQAYGGPGLDYLFDVVVFEE